jgi:hypothetical protein
MDEMTKARYEIFKENQAKLPEQDRVAPPRVDLCTAKSDDGFSCTKASHTEGDHIAHGMLGTVLFRWM